MPLMTYGNLEDILVHQYGGIKDESIIATILKDVIVGMQESHTNDLLHRDLKAKNILVSQ